MIKTVSNIAKIFSLLILLFISFSTFVSAHPGNTSSDGAHYCWTNCASWGEVYGQRHSHGSSYSAPTYNYSTPTYNYTPPSTPSCPSNSYASGSSCKCNYGYVVSGNSCVSGNSLCHNQLGYMSSYNSLSNKCECDYGYVIGSSGSCVYKSNYTGSYSAPSYSYSASENSCPAHSSESLTDPDKCSCDSGYQVNNKKTGCTKISKKTNDKLCKADFGNKSEWNGKYDKTDDQPYCKCMKKYEWNEDETKCVKSE